MNQTAHDYSRHSDDELHEAIRLVDVQRHPERALGLIQELERRLSSARQAAAIVADAVAIRTGASFSQVDPPVRRTLFWRLFWWSVIFSVVAGFLQGLAMSVIDELLNEYYTGPPRRRFWIDSLLSLLALALMAVAFWRLWLGFITKRSYGGHGVRVVKSGPPADAA
jgi:ABC-type sugar transport system permease subunit